MYRQPLEARRPGTAGRTQHGRVRRHQLASAVADDVLQHTAVPGNVQHPPAQPLVRGLAGNKTGFRVVRLHPHGSARALTGPGAPTARPTPGARALPTKATRTSPATRPARVTPGTSRRPQPSRSFVPGLLPRTRAFRSEAASGSSWFHPSCGQPSSGQGGRGGARDGRAQSMMGYLVVARSLMGHIGACMQNIVQHVLRKCVVGACVAGHVMGRGDSCRVTCLERPGEHEAPETASSWKGWTSSSGLFPPSAFIIFQPLQHSHLLLLRARKTALVVKFIRYPLSSDCWTLVSV